MNKMAKGGMLLLCLILVVGLVLTGCGKKEAALQQPELELVQYVRGSTVDFDGATLNAMADSGGEPGFKFGLMKAIYPTIWNTNKETVANQLFPPPYWRGDGVTTQYDLLTSADQSTVDGVIFATKLSAAEQQVVNSAVEGFFGLYADETAAAKPLEQNTAYGILLTRVSAAAAEAWKADAAAWMAALDNYTSANYGGKTYAQLTYVDRKKVEAVVFAKGAGTINPEYSFWRSMVKNSFRNGIAAATYPNVAEDNATAMYGKSYLALDPCSEKPVVDGAVWAFLTAAQQANVTERVAGIFTLATEQVNGVIPDNLNIYYQTLRSLPDYLTTDNSAATAAADWLAAVNGTTPGTTENTSFYAELLYGQPQWKGMLAYKYFGTDNYSALSPAQQAVVDQADEGMFALSVAQRSPAMPLTSNILYRTLEGNVGATAAEGWAADVGAGLDRELAFYKWLGYESFRNTAAATFYPTQVAAKTAELYPDKTSLTICEQLAVNAAVWAELGEGERGYVTTSVGNMWAKVQAEMTNAVAIDQTTMAMTIKSGTKTETSVKNFKADVEGGMFIRQAFYRWLAKERVTEMASAAPLIQLSVGEFYIKITNPNKYGISIDTLRLRFTTTIGDVSVDCARQMVEDVWIPAKDEVVLKVVAPTKNLDVISWLVIAGRDSTTARSMAAQIWSKIQDGTIVWGVIAEAQVSHGDEVQDYSYTL